MFQAIDQLITAYEKGTFTRRQLLSGLAALGLGGTSLSAAQQRAPGGSVRINHVNLRVSNLQRSADFYEKIFNTGVRHAATYTAVDVGAGSFVPYLSLQSDANVATEGRSRFPSRWQTSLTTKPGIFEHVAIEVDNFDYDKTLAALKGAGVETTADKELIWTHDPEGALLQIFDSKSAVAKSAARLTR